MKENGSMFSPEVVEAIARNAGALRQAMTSGDEAAVLGSGQCGRADCCAPRFIKFKFILCDVEINNINAVAVEDNGPRPC